MFKKFEKNYEIRTKNWREVEKIFRKFYIKFGKSGGKTVEL